MQHVWLEEIKYDIEMMDRNMARDFRMKAGNVLGMAPVNIDTLDKNIRPALLILMTRLFSGNPAKAITMSAVIQFIYFATVIHNNIKDNEEKFKPQLPVLIGDYLYSKFFSYLSQHDALQFLAPLSQVICDIHTAGIIRKEVIEAGQAKTTDYYQVLRQEHGLLMAESCKIAASISNVSKDIEELSYKFGLYVGMAWGALKDKAKPVIVHEALGKAHDVLVQLPAGETRDVLKNILDMIENATKPVRLESNLA